MSKIIKIKKESGYTVVELLFYISFFVILSILAINAMISMGKSFRETTVQAQFVQSGAIPERMGRETRQAYDIDLTSTATDLKLNTKDSAGANKTMEFKFVSGNIQIWDAGVNIGNLNPPNIVITSLAFTQITLLKSKAVKIVLSLRSTNDLQARVQNFYDTAVLRGSYKK